MMSDSDMLDQMNEFVTANMRTISILGARANALGKFFSAVLPHLTTPQCIEVNRSFRQGIEDVIALMDDVALPAEYHSALLEVTSYIFAGLDRESATHQ